MVGSERLKARVMRENGGMLTDLGIVQLLAETQRDLSAAGARSDPHHTPTNDPAYVAPEIVDGGDATVASEVYALGLTLHEAVAGASVYGTLPADPQDRRAHVQAASITISQALSDGLRALLERCLARGRRPMCPPFSGASSRRSLGQRFDSGVR